MTNTIALLDCDSFFVSCEQVIDPRLKNKPVCVMSNNDSCVVARSKEAKALGIKMGMPMFQAKRLFPQAIYLTGNLPYYYEVSSRVMGTAREFSPKVEVYSVDECFVDFTGLSKYYNTSFEQMAVMLRYDIAKKTGIPVSIGIATSKTLAKLASEKAKKMNGVYEITKDNIVSELKNTKIGEIWGIGAKTNYNLAKYGIVTAFDFVQKNDEWVKKRFGKRGIEIKFELLGVSIYPINEKYVPPKSIQKTNTFAKSTSDRQFIKNEMTYHIHRACKKLRAMDLASNTIVFMLKTRHFNIITTKRILKFTSNSEFEFNRFIEEALSEIYDENMVYRSAGIMLENLTSDERTQLSLFAPEENREKLKNISKAWDKIERKFGKNGITLLDFFVTK